MHSKKGMIAVITLAAVFAASITGCVKQRGDRYNPGVVRDAAQPGFGTNTGEPGAPNWGFKAFSADDNRVIKRSQYTLTTGPVAIKKTKNSEAENLIIEPEVKDMRQFDVMSFVTEDKYLKGKDTVAEMLGEPNKTYGIAYEMTPNFLILYKVVQENELSDFEKSYATVDGNEYLVPIGGYAIEKFYNLIKAPNEDGRPTNLIIEENVPRKDYLKAQYFSINENDFKKFERQEKFDVLKKSFFEGEWYFSETTVEARLDRGTVVGDLGSSDSNFASATRIIFMKQGNNLVGLNTNVDEEFKKEDDAYLNYNTVIKIPVENLDYRRFVTGMDVLKESVDDIKNIEEREYIKLDFLKSETPQSVINSILASIFNQINDFKTLLDVTYGVNYFSFSVRDAESGSIKRYSFKRITDKGINPRRAFREDNYVFGTFTTVKSKKLDYKVNLQEDAEKLILMARHNPEKDIVFYFTDQTVKDSDPEYGWHRDIGRESINLWNQAFKAAGLKIQVRLDESKDVPLGDIRYNVLNIVRRAGAGLLGFGPSLIDSETGEIVSASMNVGMDNMMEQYYRVVRDYLGRKSGRYYNFRKDGDDTAIPTIIGLIAKVNDRKYYVDSESGQIRLMSDVGLTADKTQLDPAQFTDKEKEFLNFFKIPLNSTMSSFVKKVTEQRIASYQHANFASVFNITSKGDVFEEDFSATEVTDSNIEKNCPEVKELAQTLKTTPVDTEQEIQIIRPCVILFTRVDALTTVLHELGHNLSMRHNFIGSVDEKNFPKTGTFKLKYMTDIPKDMLLPKSSSVMEYLTMEGQQIDLGGYDIATIRWIYGDEVEDVNGEMRKIYNVDPKTGLRKYNVRIQDVVPQGQLKPFMYCTDEQRILLTDPRCAWFDQGITAKESVAYSVEATYDLLSKLYRYDNFIIRGDRIASGLVREIENLVAHYNKWRFFLLRETGISRGYMQKMDRKAYTDLVNRLLNSSDPAVKAQAKEYMEIRNIMTRMLVDLAFISNKYCLVTDSDNQERLVELEKIRRELFGSGEFSVVSSCDSPGAAEYLKAKDLTLVKEFGHFLDAGTFDLDPNKIEQLDYAGTSSIRTVAFRQLTMRMVPSWNNIKDFIFAPTMMDEPDIRFYVQELLADRMLNGVRVSDKDAKKEIYSMGTRTFDETDVKAVTTLPAYANYSNESDLYTNFSLYAQGSLYIPGEPDDGRSMMFFVGRNPNEDQIKNAAANYLDVGSTYLYVRRNETVAGKMMSKAQDLSEKLFLTSNLDAGQLVTLKGEILADLQAQNVLPTTTPVTLKDVAVIGEYLSKAFGDSKKSMGFKLLLQEIFRPELALYEQIANIANQQLGVSPAELLAALNDPNAAPDLKATATQFLGQAAPYNLLTPQPTLANVETRINSFTTSYTTDHKFYNKFNEELESQLNFLVNTLTWLSR